MWKWCANMHYRKNQVFLWYTINSQSKLKKIQHTSLEIPTKKNSLRNLTWFHLGLFELEILDIFQALQSALLKSETKNLLKKDTNQLKIVWLLDSWHSKRQKQKIKKEKKKAKNEKKLTTAFLLLVFYTGKFILC